MEKLFRGRRGWRMAVVPVICSFAAGVVVTASIWGGDVVGAWGGSCGERAGGCGGACCDGGGAEGGGGVCVGATAV